ncbi:MAG TPA: prolyl oligopeptidase family serine peptidase, partial [Candidatus Elarobacter sp.]
YALKSVAAGDALAVRDLDDGTERRIPGASAPVFLPDGHLMYRILDTVYVLARGGGELQTLDHVNRTCSGVGATQLVAALVSSGSASATGTPAGSLVIVNVAGGVRTTIPNVRDCAVADDGDHVAFVQERAAGTGAALQIFDASQGTSSIVASGAERYQSLSFSPGAKNLAYLSPAGTSAATQHLALFVADSVAASAPVPAPEMVDAIDGMLPSSRSPIRWEADGSRLTFPLDSGTAPRVAVPDVELWSYRSSDLPTQTRRAASPAGLGQYTLRTRRAVLLKRVTDARIDLGDGGTFALAHDAAPYRREYSWIGKSYSDDYAVSRIDGSRRLVIRRSAGSQLSPKGRYVLSWDEHHRRWFTVRTDDGCRTDLGSPSSAAFWNEAYDRPSAPPPYGFGGWLADDAGVLLYDQYDVWLADPRTGRLTDLTHGAGRRAHVVYSVLQLDPSATVFAAGVPMTLGFVDERTLETGYARIAFIGGTPQVLLRRNAAVNAPDNEPFAEAHDRVMAPLKARRASRVAFTVQRFDQFPDIWTSDDSFTAPQRSTDVNPQQRRYAWGTERLISWRTPSGGTLRGTLILPPAFDRTKRYPMLVTFYERYTNAYHRYWPPAPGTIPNFSRYASNGYVVFLPDIRYRIGEPGRSAYDAVCSGVDAVVREGFVDPSRIGLAGHSWSGSLIDDIITRTARFRAVEAGAAVSDMVSGYGELRADAGEVREAQYERGQSRIGAAPWERPDLYVQNSAIFRADRVRTPYLSIHNEDDGTVPRAQGIEFFTALRRLGKVAYLFSFHGEGHELRDRAHQQYWTDRLDEWFDYWLRDSKRPGWLDAGLAQEPGS